MTEAKICELFRTPLSYVPYYEECTCELLIMGSLRQFHNPIPVVGFGIVELFRGRVLSLQFYRFEGKI